MKKGLLGAALLVALSLSGAEGEPRRILLTVEKGASEPLTAADLLVKVDKKRAEVLRVYQSQELPVHLAVLIADNTGPEVAQNLGELRTFLEGLPGSSEVLVGYLRAGAVEVRQPFTTDRAAATAALRVPRQGPDAAFDFWQSLEDALDYFPENLGRAQILYIGDEPPYDISTGYQHDSRVNRALRAVQEKGMAVWAIHVAKVDTIDTSGKWVAALHWLTEQTGGRTFSPWKHPTSLAPYLREFRALLDRQYLVEFAPPGNAGKLEISVEGAKLRLRHSSR